MAHINKYCRPFLSAMETCVFVCPLLCLSKHSVCSYCWPVAAAAAVVADWQRRGQDPSPRLLPRSRLLRLLLPPPARLLRLLLRGLRRGLQQGGWSDAPYPRNTRSLLGGGADIYQSLLTFCVAKLFQLNEKRTTSFKLLLYPHHIK